MKLNFLPFFLIAAGTAFGQVGYRTAATNTPQRKTYDSLANFKDLFCDYQASSMLGQEIYFVKRPPGFKPINSTDTVYYNFELKKKGSEAKEKVKGRLSAFVPGVGGAAKAIIKSDKLYKSITQTFSSVESETTPYSSIEGKSFKIISWRDSSLGDNKYLSLYTIGLQDQEGVKFSWELHLRDMPPFPVHLNGYLEKLKSTYLNKILYFKTHDWNTAQRYNVVDKKMYTLTPGNKWTCTEITFFPREKGFPELYLILKNKNNVEMAVSTSTDRTDSPVISDFWDEAHNTAYLDGVKKTLEEKNAKHREDSIRQSVEQANNAEEHRQEMIKLYGKANGELIAKGQIKLGMTKDMCASAWGSPSHTNSTQSVSGTVEVWSYNNNRWLTFIGNKLTQITD